MQHRLPTLASIVAIYLTVLAWFCHLQITYATSTNNTSDLPPQMDNDTHSALICTPFTDCMPCPDAARHQPFCQPFGNRRLVHCINATSPEAPPPDSMGPMAHNGRPRPPPPPPPPHEGADRQEGKIVAWESCGRIVSQERADFYEFVACNVIFAVVALTVLFARSRRLNALQARQLAARIGLVRGNTRI